MQTGSTYKRHISASGAAYGYGSKNHGCQGSPRVKQLPKTADRQARIASVENAPYPDTRFVTVDAIFDLLAAVA